MLVIKQHQHSEQSFIKYYKMFHSKYNNLTFFLQEQWQISFRTIFSSHVNLPTTGEMRL